MGRTQTGVYRDTLTSSANCDSVRTLTLTVIPTATSSIGQTICQGQSFLGRTQTGVYRDTLTSSANCDSIRTLTLTVIPTTTSNVSQTICQGQSFLGRTQTGVYRDTLTSSANCDSIRTLTLTVVPAATSGISQTICPGGSYMFNGVAVSFAGNYSDTLQTASGCDSIVTLTLTVVSNPVSTITATACTSYLSPSGLHTWMTSGTYQDTVAAIAGCDTVITVNLTITNINDTAIVNGAVCSVLQAGAIYQWIDCAGGQNITGATSQTFTASQNGSYKCALTVGNCSDTTNCVQVVSIGLETLTKDAFNIYPNPSTGLFEVVGSTVIQHVEIFDATGRMVYAREINSNKASIDLGSQGYGIYLIRVISENESVIRKIVISN